MAHSQHPFNIQGVQNIAYYLKSVTSQDVADVNNNIKLYEGEERDGLWSSYIEFIKDNVRFQTLYTWFKNKDIVGMISTAAKQLSYTENSDDFLGYKRQITPDIFGDEYVYFYNTPLPDGWAPAHAYNIKIANLLSNVLYGAKKDNYTIYCFDPITLIGFQPIVFTVAKTGQTNTGTEEEPVWELELTVTVTDSSGGLEYSIDDGQNWQGSNVFGGLSKGLKTILVKDSANVQNSRDFLLSVDDF